VSIVAADRAEILERHGREYGRLRLAVGWTLGLEGDDAKVSRHWQSSPDRLADEEHGAALLAGRGSRRNPVVSLRASGLIGVDVDGEPGRTLVRELVPAGLPRTVIVASGREDGGHHFWYRPPADCAHAKVEFSGDGLKLSTDGYLVIPPSLHGATGRPYSFLEGCAPWEREITELPGALYRMLREHDRQIDESERADDTGPIGEGSRHRHLLRLGCAMRRVGAGEQTILAALQVENSRRCHPPKTDEHVRELARDITHRYLPGKAKP
jgi:Bifunctional DNA primase/polymerase, N-terminal/Primase C terminal 1 (PriCT-1)